MSRCRKIPWLTEAAIAFMESYLKSNMQVLEFGAGGSTIWMSRRCHVTTIEHDAAWIEELTPNVPAYNWRHVVEPCPHYDLCEQWPDEVFDLVLVDGRDCQRGEDYDRVVCAERSVRLVRPGGILMLDNAERQGYERVGDGVCKDWNVTTSIQRQPDTEGFVYDDWTTAWWRKPQ
jgi:predicted O-methyltransferase YrrM